MKQKKFGKCPGVINGAVCGSTNFYFMVRASHVTKKRTYRCRVCGTVTEEKNLLPMLDRVKEASIAPKKKVTSKKVAQI